MSYKKNYNNRNSGGYGDDNSGGGYKKSWNNNNNGYGGGYNDNGGGYKKNWNNNNNGYGDDNSGGGYKKSWNNNNGGGYNNQDNGGGYKKNWNNSNGRDYNNRDYNNNNYNNNNDESSNNGEGFYIDKKGSRNGRSYGNDNRNGGGRYNNNNNNNNNNYDDNNNNRQSYNKNNNNNNNNESYNNNKNNNKKSQTKEDESIEEATKPSAPQLDLDTRSYFTRIESLINKQEESVEQEEIDIIIENAFKEIESKEVEVACDKKTSLVLESMFQKCKDPKVLVKYFVSFCKDSEKLIHDPNGSRVLEGLLRSTPKIVNRSDKETLIQFNETLFSLIDLLLNDILKTVTDRYASYVFSSAILILSGTVKEKKIPNGGANAAETTFNGGKKKSYKEKLEAQAAAEKQESNEYPVSKEFTDKLKQVLDKVKEPIKSNMVKFSTQKEPIESIKSIFIVLSNAPIEIYRSWLEAFVKMSNIEFSTKQLIKTMKNQYGSVFCETLIKTAPEAIFLEFIQLVKHDLLDLSEDMYANHVIQTMIDHCNASSTFLTLVQEFKDHFKQLFKMGRGVVVQKLIECSLKFSTYEKEIVKLLYEAVLPNYKTDQKDIAQHLLGLEGNVSHNQMYSACGALILQLLFKMSNDFNKAAIESFIGLEIEYLVSLATNVIGSKVLDVFLDSVNVPLAKKNQLIVKFNGNFVTIGEDRYGSYSIEKMYKIADFKQKDVIAVELMKEEQRLFSRPCGRYVLMICQINKYKKKKESWASEVNQKDKKRKLFSDILNDDGSNKNNNNNNNNNNNKQKKQVEQVDGDYNEDQEEQEEQEQPKKKSKKSKNEEEVDEIDDIFNNSSKSSSSSSSSSKNKKKK